MPQVVTQLIVDASGAKTGVAEFEAAMGRAKQAAVDGGEATATSFERAQTRWTASLAKTDPVIKAQIAMEKDLARQREIGANAVKLGIASEDAASAQLERVRQQHVTYISTLQSTSAANENVAKSTGLASYQVTNLFRQLNDVATGLVSGQSPFMVAAQQTGQIVDVFQGGNVTAKGFFDQVTAGAARVLTPMRLLVAGVVGVGAAAIYMGNNWKESEAQIDRALTGIGARTGETLQSINKFSSDNASATGLSVSEARNIALEFTKTGNIAVSGLKGVGDAIHGYAVLTGKDATEATKDFASALGGDLVKGAEKINETYGTLNSASLEYIRTLQLSGDRSAAIQVIIDSMSSANLKAADSVGILSKAWTGLKNVASNVFNGVPSSTSDADKLAQLQSQRSAAASSPSLVGGNAGGYGLLNTGSLAGGKSQQLSDLDKQIDDLQKKVDAFNAAKVVGQLNAMSLAGDTVVKSIVPQIDQINNLEQALATLQAAQNTPGVSRSLGSDDAAVTAIQNQIAGLKDAQGQAERYNQRVAEISTQWGDVGQSTALALQSAQNQLPVLEAVGGGAKMAAQSVADYKNYMDQGKTSTEAAALASSNLAASQAQVNSAAKEQLAALQDQAAVAGARTPLEAAVAQGVATTNALLRQGVDLETARAVGAQQTANAEAQIGVQMDKAVKASQDQLDLTRAQGTSHEKVLKAQIAYSNAIDAGATSTQASAIYSNTLATETIKAARAAEQAADQAWRMQDAFEAAAHAAGDVVGGDAGRYASTSGTFKPDPNLTTKTGAGPAGTVPYWQQQLLTNAPAPGNATTIANSILAGGNVDAAISAIQGLSAGNITSNPAAYLESQLGFAPGSFGVSKSTTISQSDIVSLVGQLYTAKNAQTSDKSQQAANLQQELAWLQSQPQSLDTINAITSLKSSIESLTNSTDSLTSVNQDLLSPYYSQDPRTSHIGFRSQGMATGGEFTVPGGYSANDNMLAQIPVASGEIVSVRRPGQDLGGGSTQQINMGGIHITVQGGGGQVNANAIGRTVYQAAQAAAKQLAMAGR